MKPQKVKSSNRSSQMKYKPKSVQRNFMLFDAFFRRWRVFTTFLTGCLIGLFFAFILSDKFELFPNFIEQRILVLISSGILGGVIYTIMSDGHVELPRYKEGGDIFEAGLFGDIIIGIAGAFIMDFLLSSAGNSGEIRIPSESGGAELIFPAQVSYVATAAKGVVGGYGGKALLDIAFEKFLKRVNKLETERESAQRLAYQLNRLTEHLNEGLSPEELENLIQSVQRTSSEERAKIFRVVKDFRQMSSRSNEFRQKTQRTIPIFESLIKVEPGNHYYHAQLAYAYKDALQPNLSGALEHLNQAIDFRGPQVQGTTTWKYELNRASVRILRNYDSKGVFIHESAEQQERIYSLIVQDLLDVDNAAGGLAEILQQARTNHINTPLLNWLKAHSQQLGSQIETQQLLKALGDIKDDGETIADAPGPNLDTSNRSDIPEVSNRKASIEPFPIDQIDRIKTILNVDRSRSGANRTEHTSIPETSNELARWNIALANVKLNTLELQPYRNMAKEDLPRVQDLADRFRHAGEKFDVPPAILAGIASRESRCNKEFDADGYFGIMQIDRKSFTPAGFLGEADSQVHINEAAEIFSRYLTRLEKQYVRWSDEQLLQGALAAYEYSFDHAESNLDAEYVQDVITRAQLFNENFFHTKQARFSTALSLKESLETYSTDVIQRVLEAEVDGAIPIQELSYKSTYAIYIALIKLGFLEPTDGIDRIADGWKIFKETVNQTSPEMIGTGSTQALLDALRRLDRSSHTPSTSNFEEVSDSIPQQVIELIKEEEGFRSEAYKDPGHGWKVPTIGYGTTKYPPDGRPVQRGDTITRLQAEECLIYALEHEFKPALEKIPTWSRMNSNQQSALLSFAYNLGKGFYKGNNFDSITALCDHPENWSDLIHVRKVFGLYVKSNGEVFAGLVKRRREEADLFCKPAPSRNGSNLGGGNLRHRKVLDKRFVNDPNPPLNVRSGPGKGNKIVNKLLNETIVSVVSVENGWLQISHPVQGWIYEKNTAKFLIKFTSDRNPPTNVRSGPGRDYKVIEKLSNGTSIQVIEERDGWIHLVNPVDGWISQNLAVSASKGVSGSPVLLSMTDAEKYEYCRQLIEASGGTFREGSNQRNLIGFRKETSTRAKSGTGEYDDKLLMVWKSSSAQYKIREYSYCTEPTSQYEARSNLRTRKIQGVDANRDGIRDLGRIPPGYYEYKSGSTPSHKRALISTAEIMAERDTDHDGKFEAHEPKASAGFSMLFHSGSRSNTDSAGCQTFHPNIFNQFWKDLHANGTPDVIGYTLVDWKV